jgi:ribosomal protein L37AE/L43A
MSAQGDKEMADLLEAMELKMANPPDTCERCQRPMDEHHRFWEHHSGQWLCSKCDAEVPGS